ASVYRTGLAGAVVAGTVLRAGTLAAGAGGGTAAEVCRAAWPGPPPPARARPEPAASAAAGTATATAMRRRPAPPDPPPPAPARARSRSGLRSAVACVKPRRSIVVSSSSVGMIVLLQVRVAERRAQLAQGVMGLALDGPGTAAQGIGGLLDRQVLEVAQHQHR